MIVIAAIVCGLADFTFYMLGLPLLSKVKNIFQIGHCWPLQFIMTPFFLLAL